MKQFKILVCTLILFLVFGSTFAEMYKWVDKNGVMRFSDAPTQGPGDEIEYESLPTVATTPLPQIETETAPADLPNTDETLPKSEANPPKAFIDDTITASDSGRVLFASGFAVKEGRRMEFHSATASWNKTDAELNVNIFPFELTPQEEIEILAGDKNSILYSHSLRERPFLDEDFFFWLNIELNKNADRYNFSSIKSYSFSFHYFDDKGTSTGCGDWVKDYSHFENFQSVISDDGGAISFDFSSKAGTPFNWDIKFTVKTKIHEVY